MLAKSKLLKAIFAVLLGLVVGLPAQNEVKGQVNSGWSQPVNLSSKMAQAWFPDITIDSSGEAHIVFSGSDLYSDKGTSIWERYDRLYYQPVAKDGNISDKGPFNVAVSPFGVVMRNSVAIDSKRGLIYILYRSKGSLFFQYAPIEKAGLPLAWSNPRNIDDFSSSYYSDIAVDQRGTIHIIWSQAQPDSAGKLRQVIMYRQSSDIGTVWSFPKIIGMPRMAATRPVIKIDQANGLHVSWDDGYDNYVPNETVATFGAYTRSLDNGRTWSGPVWFGIQSEPIAQMVVTPFETNGVMLTWRVLQKQRIEYTVSNDRGATWSEPKAVPGLSARGFSSQHFFDRYYLAADSRNRVHLAAVAQVKPIPMADKEGPFDLAIFHHVWQAGEWGKAEQVAQLEGYPEYPRLAIGPDRLHLVWFVRDSSTTEGNKQLWYASRPYDSGFSAQPVKIYTPPTPTPEASRQDTKATPTAMAILPPVESSPPRIWIEEGYGTTVLALVPVVVGGLVIAGLLLWKTRRSRRR